MQVLFVMSFIHEEMRIKKPCKDILSLQGFLLITGLPSSDTCLLVSLFACILSPFTASSITIVRGNIVQRAARFLARLFGQTQLSHQTNRIKPDLTTGFAVCELDHHFGICGVCFECDCFLLKPMRTGWAIQGFGLL